MLRHPPIAAGHPRARLLVALFLVFGTGCRGSQVVDDSNAGDDVVSAGVDTATSIDVQPTPPPVLGWARGPDLTASRSLHSATLLADGRVLVVGGNDALGKAVDSCEVFKAQPDAWSAVASLGAARRGHTATRLVDGRVLVVGGVKNTAVASVERYDPESDAWTGLDPLPGPRFDHSATLLLDGRVLAVGGFDAALEALATVWINEDGVWAEASPLPQPRARHAATALADGRVLVVCGHGLSACGFGVAPTMIYDPTADAWSEIGGLSGLRNWGHTLTRLPDDRVILVGGFSALDITVGGTLVSAGFDVPLVDLWDPATADWTATPDLAVSRGSHTTTLLQDGRLLVVGGGWFRHEGWTSLGSTEITDVSDGAVWTDAGMLAYARIGHTATRLLDGRVLVAGGRDAARVSELYTP